MAEDYVNLLLKLAGSFKPVERPNADDWESVEAELGVTLAIDYKNLVGAFGTGAFGRGLEFKNPSASASSQHLSRGELLAHREMMAGLVKEFGIPLYPDSGGLVLIANMDRQDFLLRSGKDSGQLNGLVWWNMDVDEVSNLEMLPSEFLYKLYLGQIAHPWAEQLRNYIWQNGAVPFFTPWRRPFDTFT